MARLISFILLLFLILISQQLLAQWLTKINEPTHRSLHQYNHSQLIAPVTLTASGAAIGLNAYLHNNIDVSLHDALSDHDVNHLGVENYLQYVPAVTPFALNICGLKGKHGYRDLFCLTAASYLLVTVVGGGLKYAVAQPRPTGPSLNSFPSGHTYTAFVGAEILRREYGSEYPGIAIAGYAVASAVGVMRVYNHRHWASDILGGAGVGILCTAAAYWLAPYLTF
ncbi:MAG: phosphatase PAP2 family protein [Bacteroidales bacterium]|nr:phosphatase PAP2 family protein [Candidatus Colimorpha onthohippi]